MSAVILFSETLSSAVKESKMATDNRENCFDKNVQDGGCDEKSKEEKLFTLKKWNAVAMWSWDVVSDTCAICRVQVMGIELNFLKFNYAYFHVNSTPKIRQ